MAPRPPANPAPKTDAARAQIAKFFCELCGKGYTRQEEFAAHENSYEHNHNQRRKDLQKVNIKMSQKKSKADSSESGLVGIKPISLNPSGTGAKKAGFKRAFKNAFGDANDSKAKGRKEEDAKKDEDTKADEASKEEERDPEDDESDAEDPDYEYYDPLKPTACGPHCLVPAH